MVRIAFVMGEYPAGEDDRRAAVARSYATREVEVGVICAPITPYFHGMTQTEMALVAPAVVEGFRRAEAEGYDAAVPLGFLDLGLDAGRSAVDIPIIAPCEAALHLASLLGDRFGLIAYHENQFANLRTLVRRYGMADRVVGWAASGFDLPDIVGNEEAMKQNFLVAARKLIAENGADVIIPTGVSQCPVHINPKWLMEQLGAPVVEGIGAPIRLAALYADLGMHHSRYRWRKSPTYAKPAR